MRGFYKNEKPEIGFDLTGSNGEQKRLAHLINSIAENSPAGRKILETAAKEGYALCFENPGLSHGICNSRQKRIALNPRGDRQLENGRGVAENESGIVRGTVPFRR